MFLLDMNVLSEIIRREPNRHVVAKFEAAPDEQLFTSVICVEEVAFGASIAPEGNRIGERFERKLLTRVRVIEFGLYSALQSGRVRGEARKGGMPIDYPDALIAAAAKEYGLTRVTRNTPHFNHVAGLKLENWFEQESSAPLQ